MSRFVTALAALLLGLARFGFGVQFAEPVSLVMAIISVIVFFVLITSKEEALRHAAIMVASTTELSLYTLTTFAVLVGMFQVLYPFLHKCSIAALK